MIRTWEKGDWIMATMSCSGSIKGGVYMLDTHTSEVPSVYVENWKERKAKNDLGFACNCENSWIYFGKTKPTEEEIKMYKMKQ